jgi:hypothetical protein
MVATRRSTLLAEDSSHSNSKPSELGILPSTMKKKTRSTRKKVAHASSSKDESPLSKKAKLRAVLENLENEGTIRIVTTKL